MPRNNLSEQIKWLLKEKPFIPPAISLVAYDPSTPTDSPANSEQDALPAEFVVHNVLGSGPARPNIQPTPPSSFSETRSNPTGPPPSDSATTTEMARLRGPPGSAKPRLRIAEMPMYGPAPTRPDIQTQTVIDPVKPPPSTSRARAKGTRDVENLDIEAIDLTQDNREVSLVSPRREKRGQKRKSDEFEQDCRKVKSPRPAKPAPAPSPAPFDAEEFPDITDISPFPTSPPPPYSTTEPAYQAPADIQAQDFDYQDDDDLGFRVPESDEGEYCPDAEPYVPQANRKRKSLSRVPSNASIPPRKMGKQIKELSPAKVVRSTTDLHQNHERPRPTPTRKVRQAVMDSEDDGTFEDLDEMELEPPSPIDTSKPQLHKSERSFAQPLSQRSHRDQQVPASLPIRSPAKSMKVLSSQGLKLERVPTTARSPQALQTRLSPVKAQSPQRSDAVLQSSSSARSKENRDNIRRAVEDFLKAEGPRLPEHLKNACRNWDREVKAYQEQIEEFGQPDQSTDEKVQAARSRKNAVEKLVTLESEHRRLTTKREENRRKIKNDLENGIFTIDGSVAFKLNKALEEVEEQIYKLLDVVRLQSPFKTPQRHIDEEEVSEVMVRSTQHTPAFRTKDALHSPRAHHIPETQYVKQSEISVREVWTPSKEIRFAENFAESPPPPQEYSNNVTFRRGLQTDKASPQPKERSHRVPETPRRHSKDLQGPGQSKSTRDSIVSGYESFHTPDDFPDGFDDDDNLFSNHMGSPPCNVDQDENFCDDDDADFLDDLANIEHRPPGNFDWKGDRIEPQPRQLSKEKETTVARTRQKKSASSPQKTQSTTIGMNHPWSEDVKAALLQQFGLRGFRPGQLEAVNATLNGDHCFVLMPTGGGKSLCYQLPSVIRSGKTRGVTIVISPLLSLMEDQVEACRNRFGMQAHLINGETTKDIKDFIMSALGERDPQSFIQVLYVTPEMLSKSTRMIDSFQKLYQNGNLARIVIDEAHCVSQWGHDFRPDYKALGNVLRQFSGVPIMALTATATQLVQTDVIANLGIRGCRKFSQSFNRPNLSYEVREKKGKVIPNIAELIQSKYPKKSGIVYCLARKTCESVAQQLTSLGVRAHHYHAGMESAERSAVQRKWQSNEYHVIVATIAFGMGIDKADVRFVIHHSLPKSLEGYYQETGRAGRDGKRSGCYLFYNYGDSNSLRKMIEDSDGNREQKQRQHDMLRNVIQFCENKSDCRRAQVLNYFSEQFRPEDCNQTCDNCRSDATYEEQDLTQYAVAALNLVAQVEDNKVTKLQCIDAFRGAKGSKLKPLQLEEFGFGQSLHRGDVERLFSALLQERALREESVMNKAGFATNYLKLGSTSGDFTRGRRPLKLQVEVTPGPIRKKAKPKRTAAEYPSTNISSPIRAPPKRKIQEYAYDDTGRATKSDSRPQRTSKRDNYKADKYVVADDDESDEDFEPIRVARPLTSSKSRPLGRPITVDERVAGLDEFQKDVLDDFANGAKTLAKKIQLEKSLRNQPFSDTIIREMGLDLPSNEEEMLLIPGINPDMVKYYGKRFLRLVERARAVYGNNAPQPRNQASKRRIVRPPEEEDEEDAVLDPNHRNVIDLCSPAGSDEEDKFPAPEMDEGSDVYSDEEEESDDEDAPRRVSHHFTTAPTDSRVEEFNRRFSQLEAQQQSQAPSKGREASTKPALPPARKLPWAKKGGYRKRSSSNFGKYPGVSKKGATKKAASKKAASGAGAAKRLSTGGGSGGARRGGGGAGGTANGWSSIMAMPT